MVARGYDRAFAQNCFEQIKGFGSYGFPESHAASFAKLVYISSWLKCHHPAIFAAALLNSQPMGFYAPAQIVRDARDHGVEIRPVDINHSFWDNTLERDARGALALRLGFRQVDGLQEAEAARLVAARGVGYPAIEDLSRRVRLQARTLRLLADADSFGSLGLDRRATLWAIRRLPDDAPLPLFLAADAAELAPEPTMVLPAMALGEQVVADYQTIRLSLKAHPMAILRPLLNAERILTCQAANAAPDARFIRNAGLVLVRQRPGKGNAIFVTIEDETGITNLVLWARLFEQFRREVMGARLMLVEGRIQRSPEGVVHLMASRIIDRSALLDQLSTIHRADIDVARADEFLRPQVPRGPHAPPRGHHPRDVRVIPKSRDFH
jgi:error-prone DNA polymerase